MPTLNIDKSRAKGASDSEIADYFLDKPDVFDVKAARLQGLSDKDIVDTINTGQSPTEYAKGLGLQALQGATFNFSDEIGAGLASILPSIDYKDAVAGIRKKQNQFAEQNPGASLIANLGGGIATGGIGAVKALPASLPGLSKAILGGAGTGLLSGFGAGEGIGDSLGQGVQGGVAGAVLGPAASYGAKGIGLGLSNLSTGIANTFSGQGSRFLRSAAQKLEDDGLTIDQIKARLTRGGPNGPKLSLVDVAGPNISGMAETAANQPGKANNRANQFLKGRLRGQRERIANLVRETVSHNPDYLEESANDIVKTYTEKAQPVYLQAYSQGILNHEPLMKLYDNKILAPYLNKSRTVVQGDVRIPDEFKLSPAVIDQDGKPRVLYNIPHLDYVQQELYDDIQMAVRNGRMNEADRLGKIRNELLNALENKVGNPFYKEARSIWKTGKESLESLNLGIDVFKESSKYGTKELQRVVSKMTPTDKELFKLGAANSMIRIVEKSSDNIDGNPKLTLVNQLFGSPEKRNAAKVIFGDTPGGKAAYDRYKRNLIAEKRFTSTAGKILANSATFRRQAFDAIEGVDVSAAADAASALRGNASGIVNMVKRVSNNLTGRRELNDEISRRFFTDYLNEILNTLEDIKKKQNLLPNWAQSITGVGPLKQFLKKPGNENKLTTFLSGATGATVGDMGYEPTVIPITKGRAQ